MPALHTARQRISATGEISSKIDGQRQSGNQQSLPNSVIDSLYQQGSARIRFPNAQDNALQAVLLNTAGGLTGDDNIHWKATANTDSHLCISTAACEKIYRTHGPAAQQRTTLKVASGARLEWLPQESILFNGSNLNRSLDVQLEQGAEALLIESLIFGRRAMHETTTDICLRDQWRIFRGDALVHAEQLHIDTRNNHSLHSPAQLHHYSALSTIVLLSNHSYQMLELMSEKTRGLLSSQPDVARLGASILPQRLVIRMLAKDSYQLRKILIPCIELINENRAVPAVWKV